MSEKPKRKMRKVPGKVNLEELIQEASTPGRPESPAEFVHRRMRELDSETPKKKS